MVTAMSSSNRASAGLTVVVAQNQTRKTRGGVLQLRWRQQWQQVWGIFDARALHAGARRAGVGVSSYQWY